MLHPLNEVNKDLTLQEVGLGVARLRATLAGNVLLILNMDNQDKTTTFSEKITDVLSHNKKMLPSTLEYS